MGVSRYTHFPASEGISGFSFAGVACGIKKNGTKDLGLILCDRPCAAAGVFTRNRVQAAPVLVGKRRLRNKTLQAVLVNSGNANACTGPGGTEAAVTSCSSLADALGIKKHHIIPCSTGVIGVPLPVKKIIHALPRLAAHASPAGMPDFAEAILTTDTRTKTVCLGHRTRRGMLRICGAAKGSGMIMPDMATMLAFITTNASVEPELLSAALRTRTEETFNRISVDGEMSTNDTVLLLASGDAGPHMSDSRGTQFKRFEDMLHAVMQDLAQQIVQDGEGATKLLTFRVRGAASPGDAEKAARSVSNSLLVKTAFFGEDYNWGRIMGALGASGARLHMDRVDISFNGTPAVRNGTEAAANRARLKKAVRSKAIEIEIDLNAGAHSCEIAACDLSYEYVKINAEYTS